MTTKPFSTPSRQNISDSSSPREDIYNYVTDNQTFGQSNIQNSGGKQKSYHPLCVSSSKFQAKGVAPSPFFQDAAGNAFDSTDVTHSCVHSEPLQNFSGVQVIEHLELNNFKTKPCSLNTQHNHKHCAFYHNPKDRKRMGFYYSADLCDFAEKDGVTCPNGDMCAKAHNRVEQLYRPDKYKTKFCTFYPNNLEKCDYGVFCSFAHNENDIAIELIHNYEYDDDFYMFHFKTVWCPFNLTPHDKALCVYAHNWQDYRRKPHVYTYEPSPCSNWKSTDFIVNYEDGCPFKEKCTKCHGWKEHEYHPLNYKSKPCSAGKNCSKGRDCPHYHNIKEKRAPGPNILNRVFRYVPRNRIITNTFKVRSEERGGYNMQPQTQNITMNPSSTSLLSYPSLTLSHENDSLIEQHYPSIDMNLRNYEIRESIPEMKPRKQSFDCDPNRLRNNPANLNMKTIPWTEPVPVPLEKSVSRDSYKPRRWSAHEEGGFNQESDRLFREIVMSSMDKEAQKFEAFRSPKIKKIEEKEEQGADTELQNTIMLNKILENEDN